MTDYKQLIERVKELEIDVTCKSQQVELNQQQVIDALKLVEFVGKQRDRLLEKLKELEAQPSPTALELMTEYSNGKQWALEEALKVCAAEIARNDANETWICEGKRIALVIHKLKEGL